MIGQKRFMRIIRKYFGPPKTTEPLPSVIDPEFKRSSKNRENMTNDEVQYIARNNGSCPDCGVGSLLEGPRAGLSVNIRCSVCGSKFNLVPGVWGERISDPSPELEVKSGVN